MALEKMDKLPQWRTRETDDTVIHAKKMLLEFLEDEDMEVARVTGWPVKKNESKSTAAARNVGALKREIYRLDVSSFIRAARRGNNVYLYRRYEE